MLYCAFVFCFLCQVSDLLRALFANAERSVHALSFLFSELCVAVTAGSSKKKARGSAAAGVPSAGAGDEGAFVQHTQPVVYLFVTSPKHLPLQTNRVHKELTHLFCQQVRRRPHRLQSTLFPWSACWPSPL